MADLSSQRLMPDDCLWRMRTEFLLQPIKKTKRYDEHHRRMAEHWVKRAHELSRGGYAEAPGFTHDQWGNRGRRSVKGCEKPYGLSSRAFWRCVWKAIKAEFKAGWAEAMDTTYTVIDDPRYKPIITGITS